MIGELIKKMQELSAADTNYQYQIVSIQESETDGIDIMAWYECNYDQVREVEGMIGTSLNSKKDQKHHFIAIKRINK